MINARLDAWAKDDTRLAQQFRELADHTEGNHHDGWNGPKPTVSASNGLSDVEVLKRAAEIYEAHTKLHGVPAAVPTTEETS